MAYRVTIDVNGTEKFIGMMDTGTLEIKRSKAKHFYRKFNAYGMDKELLEKVLPEMECQHIKLHEAETDDYYTVSLQTFREKALPGHNRGHGAQLFLPLRYWTKS